MIGLWIFLCFLNILSFLWLLFLLAPASFINVWSIFLLRTAVVIRPSVPPACTGLEGSGLHCMRSPCGQGLMLSEPRWEVSGYSLGLVGFSREDPSSCLFQFATGLKCGLLMLSALLGAELSRVVWALRMIGFLSLDSLSQVVLPRCLFCFVRTVNTCFPAGSELVPLGDLLEWTYWPGFKDIRAFDFQLTRSLALWVTGSSSFRDFPGRSAQNQQDSW